MSAGRAPERHDVVLRWLDHQIVGPDDELLGNVDDLELVAESGDWLVTGLMVGPAALSQRLPGRLGDWLYAVWQRLHPAEHPAPVVIPIEHVVSVDSAVHVDARAARALASSFGLELWLRDHVLSHLPGATGAPEGGVSQPSRRQVGSRAERPLAPARPPLPRSRGVSTVVGRAMRDADGSRTGRVSELRCSGRPRDSRQARLRVDQLVYTPHLAASELGYSTDREQGPAAVRALVRLWQRHDRAVDVEAVEGLDDVDGELRLTGRASPRHPHEVDD